MQWPDISALSHERLQRYARDCHRRKLSAGKDLIILSIMIRPLLLWLFVFFSTFLVFSYGESHCQKQNDEGGRHAAHCSLA